MNLRRLLCGFYFPWKKPNIRQRLWCKYIGHAWSYRGSVVTIPELKFTRSDYKCYYCDKWKSVELND